MATEHVWSHDSSLAHCTACGMSRWYFGMYRETCPPGRWLPPREEDPCATCGRYGCDGTAAGHARAARATGAR